MERLKVFSLSKIETLGIDQKEKDIQVGVEEGMHSLIGRVFGDKKSQFSGSQDYFHEVVAIQMVVQGDSPGEQHVSIYLLTNLRSGSYSGREAVVL